MSQIEKRGNPEIIPKDSVIIAVCFNGNGRSKIIAQVLDQMGYHEARVMGVNRMRTLSESLLTDVQSAPYFICANTDVKSALLKHGIGENRVVFDLQMSENDHAIASGHMSENALDDLKRRLRAKLRDLGFQTTTSPPTPPSV